MGILPEQPPAYESKSAGKHENERIEGQFRTLKDALETKIGEGVSADRPALHWLVAYASGTLNRFQIDKDGKTAYNWWEGKNFKRVIP